jgi:hypothetical protein
MQMIAVVDIGSNAIRLKILPQKYRLLVSKFSALMRSADGMDVSHTGRVHGVTLEKGKRRGSCDCMGRLV